MVRMVCRQRRLRAAQVVLAAAVGDKAEAADRFEQVVGEHPRDLVPPGREQTVDAEAAVPVIGLAESAGRNQEGIGRAQQRAATRLGAGLDQHGPVAFDVAERGLDDAVRMIEFPAWRQRLGVERRDRRLGRVGGMQIVTEPLAAGGAVGRCGAEQLLPAGPLFGRQFLPAQVRQKLEVLVHRQHAAFLDQRAGDAGRDLRGVAQHRRRRRRQMQGFDRGNLGVAKARQPLFDELRAQPHLLLLLWAEHGVIHHAPFPVEGAGAVHAGRSEWRSISATSSTSAAGAPFTSRGVDKKPCGMPGYSLKYSGTPAACSRWA